MLLSKEDILKADDLPFRDVEVPEWNGTVRVRTMTGGERDAFEVDIYDRNGDKVQLNRENFRAKLLARCIVNDKNERLFTDKDIAALSGKSIKAISRLFDVAQEINGISREEQQDIKKNEMRELDVLDVQPRSLPRNDPPTIIEQPRQL